MSKATGKTIIYKQIPLEKLKKCLPFEPDIFVEGFSYQEEFGYFGPILRSWLLGLLKTPEVHSLLAKSTWRHILFSSHKRTL